MGLLKATTPLGSHRVAPVSSRPRQRCRGRVGGPEEVECHPGETALSAPGLPWWCHRGAGAALVQVQAILVGSKTDPTARMIVKDEAMREALATFAEDMAPRVFSSGKAGWHTLGKINVDGQRFQVSAQAVLLD